MEQRKKFWTSGDISSLFNEYSECCFDFDNGLVGFVLSGDS